MIFIFIIDPISGKIKNKEMVVVWAQERDVLIHFFWERYKLQGKAGK